MQRRRHTAAAPHRMMPRHTRLQGRERQSCTRTHLGGAPSPSKQQSAHRTGTGPLAVIVTKVHGVHACKRDSRKNRPPCGLCAWCMHWLGASTPLRTGCHSVTHINSMRHSNGRQRVKQMCVEAAGLLAPRLLGVPTVRQRANHTGVLCCGVLPRRYQPTGTEQGGTAHTHTQAGYCTHA